MKLFRFILLCLVVFSCSLSAADWPQWRGINRDAAWTESGIVKQFPKDGLKVLWNIPISSGYSGPVVSDGLVYVTDLIDKPVSSERVLCFNAKTGDEVWTRTYPCKYKIGYPAGPRASLVIDGGKAYSLGAMGDMLCFNAKSGEVLWHENLREVFNIKMPMWGIAASPLIYGDLIITQVGGADGACVVGINKNTGKEKWRSISDKASYSAPIIIKQAGKDVLVCWTGSRVVGLNPLDGKVYWDCYYGKSKFQMNIATPVKSGDYIFVSAFFEGSMLIKLDSKELTAKRAWKRKGENEKKTDSLQCCNSTPLIIGDYIYGVDSYGELRCLDLATGDRVWTDLTTVEKARWANIHMVKNAGKIWMFNERGELIISELSPKGFKEISRTKIIKTTKKQLSQRGGVCWTHPAYANKNIYIRNDEQLICLSLAAK
ncbi:MAG: PQQ-binding-like beta-propeller repeat protein [Planctomycetes bacterium]|nr:PQQ-binding-like beta-propeller repeat protein [Planctomycetota bacterium]